MEPFFADRLHTFRGVPPGIGSPPSVLVREFIDTRKPILIYFFYDTPPAPGGRIGTLRRIDTGGVILVRWDHIDTAGTVLARRAILVRLSILVWSGLYWYVRVHIGTTPRINTPTPYQYDPESWVRLPLARRSMFGRTEE